MFHSPASSPMRLTRFRGSDHPTVVVGMYRSGTSMVARCLSEMGAFFGDHKDHFPTDKYNPGGYFEILEVMETNRKVLGFFGMQHLRIEEIPAHWDQLPEANYLLEDLCQMMRKHFEGKDRWGFKEPQATPLMPVYDKVFPRLGLNPTFVICVRNPLDVMGTSMLPRIGDGILGLWLHYTLTALVFSKGHPRVVVPYEDFLVRPGDYLHNVVKRVPDWRPTDDDFAKATATVRPDWRTNRNDESALKDFPPIVLQVLELARECAANPEEFNNGSYDDRIHGVWIEWQHLRDMVKTRAIPHGKLTLMEQNENPERTEEWVIPTDNWQKISVKVPPTREPGLLMEIYQNPSVIWIRNAVIKGQGREERAVISQTVHGDLSGDDEMKKLIQWGWFPLFLHLPSSLRAEELELEVYIQWNVYAVEDAVHRLRNNASQFWQTS